MAIAVMAENANQINDALAELGYNMSLGYSRVGGPITPLLDAEKDDSEVSIKIRFDGEYFVIDTIDYTEGFGGQTSFETLEKIELELADRGVWIERRR